MGWRASCVEQEKLRFIADHLRGGETMAELCGRYGVSREAGYELLRRHAAEGLDCVRSRSRARLTQAAETPAEVVSAIVGLRERYPLWGAAKLRASLALRGTSLSLPSVSTVGEILRREGLIKGRRRRRTPLPASGRFRPILTANDVWGIDFKGWFRTGDGRRCDPLTVSDAHSRYLLACQAVAPREEDVEPVMDGLLREHGLPWALRSDNGPPFASSGAGGLTKLSVRWLKLGIALERIEPGCPQQNGRHERMHKTLAQATTRPAAQDQAAQQARFDAFRYEFNHERPHAALEQTTPASHWRPSTRPYPTRIEEPSYSSDHAVRRVRSNGTIKWGGELVFVSMALIGEPVGLAETADGDFVVRFLNVDLGLLERGSHRMRRCAAPRPGRRAAREPTANTVNHVTGL